MSSESTVLKNTVSIPVSQAEDILKNAMQSEVEALAGSLGALLKQFRPLAEQRFTMMKNKKVWFDRSNAALYPKFDQFALPQFAVTGRAASDYSVDFESFHFSPLNRREFMRSFMEGAGNPYLQSNGSYRGFSAENKRETDTVITGEIWTDKGCRPWCCRSDGAVYTDDNKDRWLTLVPVCRLKEVTYGVPNCMEVIWLWLENGLIPEGLSPDTEKAYTELLSAKSYLVNRRTAVEKELQEGMPAIFRMLQPVAEKRFVMMGNKGVWFDRGNAALYPRFEKYGYKTGYNTAKSKGGMRFGLVSGIHLNINGISSVNNTSTDIKYDGLDFFQINRYECIKSFVRNVNNPYIKSYDTLDNKEALFQNRIMTGEASADGATWLCDTHGACFMGEDRQLTTSILIHRLKGVNSDGMDYMEAIVTWLEKQLEPEGMPEPLRETYRSILGDGEKIKGIRAAYEHYIKAIDSENIIAFTTSRLCEDIQSGKFTSRILGHDFDYKNRAQRILHGDEKISVPRQALVRGMLDCDKIRANLPSYDDKRLKDLNLGLWELCEPAGDGCFEINLHQDSALVARPPQLDVKPSGICAIDFGTKSTVVVCRNGEERLLRVGKTDYHKKPTMEDYENPTAIELRDLQGFMKAYRGREGRPFTEWEQITVSHQALNCMLENDDQSIYQSVFSELKQWANEKNGTRRMRDQKGYDFLLPPYGELQDGGFDPIEVYAYYLGLYINNMMNGIYLEYILSLPVNYDRSVCYHLRDSFERGIRKSLPPAILRDKELMKNFRVYIGASEPAAYASCALKEMGKTDRGMRPQEGAPIYYGVFDFGGGTTDFDYGIWRLPDSGDKGSWNFVIEHFHAGGNVNLGGEKLLNLLAYEVYQHNLDTMREKKIPFALPAGCQPFVGSEMLLTEANAAYLNRRLLSEMLRPVWEEKEGYENLGKESRNINLYSEGGMTNVSLSIKVDELRKILKSRIEVGVSSFFVGLLQAFQYLKVPVYHILLAGNSCKSTLVQEAFQEGMKKWEAEIKRSYIEKHGQDKDFSGIFKLHLPLGNAAKGEEGLNFDRIPTGKTGVAFGLLDCRDGGNDVLVIDRKQDSFQYHLGYSNGYDEFCVLINREVGYNEWIPFFKISGDRFELYYSSDPRAVDKMNPMGIGELLAPKICRVKYLNGHDGGRIYIRKIAPTRIEYTVAGEEGILGEDYWAEVERCELSLA